jgi:hypothetical protein
MYTKGYHMFITEIQELKAQSPKLREELAKPNKELYRYLKYNVEAYHGTVSMRYICMQCKKEAAANIILKLADNSIGYCIDCVVEAYLNNNHDLNWPDQEAEEK